MKPNRVKWAGIAVTAVSLAIVGFGYAAVQSSGANSGSALDQAEVGVVSASQALAVQGEIQQARLPQKLESALGGAFGGVWYDQAAAQLHVGVTTHAGRRAAEAAAAEAGLEGDVSATPVRSSWAELRAEQQRLSSSPVGLSARARLKTGLDPEANAIQVELRPGVSATQRAEIERDAATSPVQVLVTVGPVSRSSREGKKSCNEFATEKAYCDPTIVAGVRIEAENTTSCTAGPTVLLESPGKPSKATETFLLTAGHCIEEGAGNGKKWSAFNTAGKKLEIGEALEFENDEIDAGIIKVNNPGSWANAGSFTPVVPTVAPWVEEKPSPFAVFAEAAPIAGTMTCYSGQMSGTHCGKILQIGVEYTWKINEESKELTEVSEVPTLNGDSGSPWFSESSPGRIEGTEVGTFENGNEAFQPLEDSLAKLKTRYQLLRTANETRHPQRLRSELAETTTVTSTADGTGKTAHHVIELDGGTVTCSSASFEGSQSGKEATELTVNPTYKECTFSGTPVTVSTGGCAYGLHASKEFAIKSRAGKNCATEPIKVEFESCKIEIGPQGPRELLGFHNIKPGAVEEVTMEMSLTGIAYKATGAKCLKAGEFSDGAYKTGNTILTGAKPGGGAMVNYRWE